MPSSQRSTAAVLLAIASFFPGCFLASGALESGGTGASSAGSGGAGAGGGAGGTAGAGGSTGTGGDPGTGGMTMTTTTPSGPPCTADTDCPSPPSTCAVTTCVAGACVTNNLDAGIPCVDPPMPAGPCSQAVCEMGACVLEPLDESMVIDAAKNEDCKLYGCDGSGNVVAKPDDTDIPLSSACTTGQCDQGNPVVISGSDGQGCAPEQGVGVATCCQGTCCNETFGYQCIDAGCCHQSKICGNDCCSFWETCCGGQCCEFCLFGQCI